MSEKSGKIRNIALIAALTAAGFYAAVRFALPWLLPFLVAAAAAALLEPAVAYLCRRGLKRGLAAGICVLIFVSAFLTLVWLLLSRLASELSGLVQRAPEIIDSVSGTLSLWRARLAGLPERCPELLADWLRQAGAALSESLARLPAALSARLPGMISAAAGAAPGVVLFAVTALIGTYFISASYPDLLHAAARLLPERFLCRARLFRRDLRRTLGRWLRAQALMMLITFGELTAAFWMLRIDYALLLALLTALIDALPVFGTGTVLVPWAVYDLLTGNIPQGVGLVVTYGAVTVLRNCIQAKLLGDQLGLHPLATLVSIYVGWKVWGVWGMLVFPILAISGKQLLAGSGLQSGRSRVYD